MLAQTAVRNGWHSCADCSKCDGNADRPCSWAAYVGVGGHQDAACNHPRNKARRKKAT